jgi:tocopherol O-methyltransferase
MPRFDASEIRRYYDRQTAGFVVLGQGGGLGAIHRAVWGPGVTTREQAFHFVEDRIAEALEPERRENLHVVDLGCGVGGSLCNLAARLPIRGTGITLSPVQARLAMERVRALGLVDRVTCIEGDYTHLPDGLAPADLAFAIESFVHGPSPERFFAECARLVKPGGVLVVCDDSDGRRTTRARRAQWAIRGRMAHQHAARRGRPARPGPRRRHRAREHHRPHTLAGARSSARPRHRGVRLPLRVTPRTTRIPHRGRSALQMFEAPLDWLRHVRFRRGSS